MTCSGSLAGSVRPASVTAWWSPLLRRCLPRRRPRSQNTKSAGWPSGGCGRDRCGPRCCVHSSNSSMVSGSRGTIRSVPSFPSGTRSQVPRDPKSTMQSSSRSRSSPTRMPVARSSPMPTRANRSSRRATAAMTLRSTSGANARGIASGIRGMSPANTSRRCGAVGQPHSAMSSKNTRRSMTSWWNTVSPTVLPVPFAPRHGRVRAQWRNGSM